MRQMANRLGISPRTVESHMAKLYRKLDVRTRVQAVSRAVSLGLIELHDCIRRHRRASTPAQSLASERPIGEA